MFLQRFTRPKWQHRNPEVRRKAIESLETSDPALKQLAQSDAEVSVRTLAITRLTDLETLGEIAFHDHNSSVQAVATERMQQLLAGSDPSSPPLEQRLEYLSRSGEAKLAEYLAVKASDPELRLAALEQVERQSLLGDIAIEDPLGEVRLLATQLIKQRSTLERVLKQARNKDKRVHRTARERLSCLIAEEERPERLKHLCQDVEKLAVQNGQIDARALQRLMANWNELQVEPEETLRQRFERAVKTAERRLAVQRADTHSKTEQEKLWNVVTSVQADLEEKEELDEEEKAAVLTQLEKLRSAWADAPSAESAKDAEFQPRFERALNVAEATCARLLLNHRRADAYRNLLTEAQQTATGAQLSAKAAEILRQRWDSLIPPESAVLMRRLTHELLVAEKNLHEQLRKQTARRAQIVNQIETLLDELKSALHQGRLQRAISLQDKILENLELLPSQRRSLLERRLQPLRSRIRELRDWRRWGSDQARSELIAKVEGLIGSELHPEQLAEKIRATRSEWQQLDKTDASTNETLWARFNAACTQAYVPCQAYFEAQAREREANLRQKTEILERLQEYLDSIDWDQPNWAELHRRLRKTQTEWREIGPVPRKAHRATEKQFRRLFDQFEQTLKPERERNLTQRRALIEQAKQLTTIEDLQKAVRVAKQLQAQWKITIPANRHQERGLWREFRGALDEVFERNRERQERENRQLQKSLAAKIATCEKLESLPELPLGELHTVPERLRGARQEWSRTGAVPDADKKAIEMRFERAIRAAEAAHRQYEDQLVETELDKLRERAALCDDLEQLAWAESSADKQEALQRIQTQWQAMPSLGENAAALIERRYQQARRTLEAPMTEQADTDMGTVNLHAKQQLCLRMEILAEVDSPPEHRKARLALQVDQLKEAMTKVGSTNIPNNRDTIRRELEREWYLTGPVRPEDARALNERFAKAVDALRKAR